MPSNETKNKTTQEGAKEDYPQLPPLPSPPPTKLYDEPIVFHVTFFRYVDENSQLKKKHFCDVMTLLLYGVYVITKFLKLNIAINFLDKIF